MKRRKPSGGSASFLIVAVLIMVGIDQFVLNGDRPYMDDVKQKGLFKTATQEYQESLATKEKITKKNPRKMGPFLGISSDTSQPIISDIMPSADSIPVYEIELPENYAVWKKNAVKAYPPSDWPRIAILIDDMGMNKKQSARTINIKGPLTLAFLPYAPDVDGLAKKGIERGHELMVHMPMEPMNSKLDMGKISLDTTQSDEDFLTMLNKGLDAFDGYVGINNHMGSRLTQDKEAMGKVMEELDDRELLFVDSRTIESSVAADVANEYGVPYAVRDVFLDHENTAEFVNESLKKLEYIARYNGSAIAIGHPRKITINELKKWIPTLKEKKIALVPVSFIIEERLKKPSAVASVPAPESSQPPQE